MQNFTNTADIMVREDKYDSKRIRREVRVVGEGWLGIFMEME